MKDIAIHGRRLKKAIFPMASLLSHSVQLARTWQHLSCLLLQAALLLATVPLTGCTARQEPETSSTVEKNEPPPPEAAVKTPLLLESYTAITGEKLDRKELIEKAAKLTKRKRNRTAIACLNDCLKLDPDDVKVLELRARCLERTGHLTDALNDIDAALAIKPDSKKLKQKKAQILDATGRTKESVTILDDLINQGGDVRNYRLRARALNANRRFEEAVEDLDVYIRARPDDFEAVRARARLSCQLKDYEKAIADYSKAIDDDDKNHDLLYGRALAYLACNRDREALADLSKAISLCDYKSSYYKARAQAYDRLGQNNLAEQDRRKAMIDDFPVTPH
ncbi:MAG: tetratricopeptide repeat protein [Candidatus Obscuribacterales bacterium]